LEHLDAIEWLQGATDPTDTVACVDQTLDDRLTGTSVGSEYDMEWLVHLVLLKV